MPEPRAAEVAARVLADRAEGEAYVASVCFKHGPPRLVGVELEFLVHDAADPGLPIDPGRLAAALGPHTPRTLVPDSPHRPLPSGAAVTLEPGCQVEISTVPQFSLQDLATVTDADLAYLTDLLAMAQLRLGTGAIDRIRPPVRLLPTERYAAMERRFAATGPDGVTMMCSTAALQVCLDAGHETDLVARWAAVHALGPVLLALFANAHKDGRASARWHAIMSMESARTAAAVPSADPAGDWARRTLDTPLMVLPRDDEPWDVPGGVTFADWIEGRAADELGRPTVEDLDYHLTSMFTPVRPHGYFEIRYLDAQPPSTWLHPVALLTALLAQPSTVDKVRELCEPVAGRWAAAAAAGLADEAIAGVASRVAELGCAELGGMGLSADTIADIARATARRIETRGRQ